MGRPIVGDSRLQRGQGLVGFPARAQDFPAFQAVNTWLPRKLEKEPGSRLGTALSLLELALPCFLVPFPTQEQGCFLSLNTPVTGPLPSCDSQEGHGGVGPRAVWMKLALGGGQGVVESSCFFGVWSIGKWESSAAPWGSPSIRGPLD